VNPFQDSVTLKRSPAGSSTLSTLQSWTETYSRINGQLFVDDLVTITGRGTSASAGFELDTKENSNNPGYTSQLVMGGTGYNFYSNVDPQSALKQVTGYGAVNMNANPNNEKITFFYIPAADNSTTIWNSEIVEMGLNGFNLSNQDFHMFTGNNKGGVRKAFIGEEGGVTGFEWQDPSSTYTSILDQADNGTTRLFANWKMSSGTQDDVTYSSWKMVIRPQSENLEFGRLAPGGGTSWDSLLILRPGLTSVVGNFITTGDINVGGNLDLQNNDLINISAIDSKIDFSSGIEFQDNLDMGSWSISNVNNMTGIGGITMAGDLDMDGFEIFNLSVIGGIEFNPTVTLNTDLDMNFYDIVNGNNATFDGALSVMGGLDLQNSDITNTNDITGGGILTMDGGFSSSSGNLSLTGGGISVSDDIVITSGNLEVQGGELTVEDNLTVNSGDVEITSGMLTVGGQIEAQDGIAVSSGDIDLGSGALVTSGDIEAGSLTVDSDVVAGGNLEADGGVFVSDVEIGGSITSVMSIEVSGPLTADEGEFFGGVSIGGDLDMNGNEILNAIIAPNLVTGFTDTTQVLRDSIQALKNMLYPAKDTVASASTTNLNITSQAQTFVISGATTITTLNLNTPIDGGTVTIFFEGSLDVTFGANVIDLAAGDGTTSLGTVSTGGFKIMTLLYHDGKFYGRE
jgi:hypothetical protein